MLSLDWLTRQPFPSCLQWKWTRSQYGALPMSTHNIVGVHIRHVCFFHSALAWNFILSTRFLRWEIARLFGAWLGSRDDEDLVALTIHVSFGEWLVFSQTFSRTSWDKLVFQINLSKSGWIKLLQRVVLFMDQSPGVTPILIFGPTRMPGVFRC